MLFIVITMTAFFSFKTNALSLSYSGSSTSNGTGASASTSGFTISYDAASSNICGYRFSIVSSNGLPKSGTRVLNVYKTDLSIGDTAYFSGQRFISSANVAANKKQLANGTYVYSTTTTQGCDCYSTAAGFYSTIPQAPSSIGDWIKNSSNSYQNLQRIYYYCGSNLANATESDYVLVEPIFWVKLAGVRTAATATELAIYGASVSGGDAYNGGNGNLYNAGSGTLWNLMNYINREFPNALYVSSNATVYNAVSVISSGRYTYKQIIQNGYGCSVLTVKNVVPIKKVYIAYHPNGGTTNTALNEWGWVMLNGTVYFHSMNHGTSDDPYNASTFGMTRAGYKFGGWKVHSTGTVLNQDTSYTSTVYAHYDDASKTTANTSTVYCYLYAVWIPNTVYVAYHPNGGTTTYPLNVNGYVMMDGTPYFHILNYGTNDDPYNASTLGLTKPGYTFKGWEILGSSAILDQDTQYASTQYTYYIDSSKTTANTEIVYCHLFAVWEKNTYTNSISHWAWGFNGNGNNVGKDAYHITNTTYQKEYGETYTLDESYAYTIPNGFYLNQIWGTSSLTGSWTSHPMGTTVTQGRNGIAVEYDYSPITYNISYDLNGGTNNSSNPSTYNVLYGVTLNEPTKENAEFLGWEMKVTKDISMPAKEHNWNYYEIMYSLRPGETYNISIDSANIISGNAENFASLNNTNIIR